MALSSTSESSIAKTEDLQRQVEARRIARTIVVPTLDLQVRQALRDRGEPITLFGERVRAVRIVCSRMVFLAAMVARCQLLRWSTFF